MKLKIRCPKCTKLYEVDSKDIRTDIPLFQCISCDSKFSFEYPPPHPHDVQCFLVEGGQGTQQQIEVEPKPTETKTCPKCGALNGRRAKECYSCHVIFERLEGLPTDASLKAQPSLVRKWKNLVANFNNQQLHDEFIWSCRELDALKFAIMKYEEIKRAQGGDSQCDLMIAKIHSMMSVIGTQKSSSEVMKASPRAKWVKYVYWAPFVLSAILIILGKANLGHRNLVGVGVALASMTIGIIIMFRGKITVSDFID